MTANQARELSLLALGIGVAYATAVASVMRWLEKGMPAVTDHGNAPTLRRVARAIIGRPQRITGRMLQEHIDAIVRGERSL